MQKPTVGRIVHFNRDGQRLPAIVIRVHNETCIDVKVMADADNDVVRSTCLDEETVAGTDNEMSNVPGCWCWPPMPVRKTIAVPAAVSSASSESDIMLLAQKAAVAGKELEVKAPTEPDIEALKKKLTEMHDQAKLTIETDKEVK